MSTRSGLLGLAGVLAAAGATAAKPPDLPAEPLVEGREPTPLVREYHEADVPRPAAGVIPAPPPRSGSPRAVADFLSGVRDTMLNRLTIPLGPAPVRD